MRFASGKSLRRNRQARLLTIAFARRSGRTGPGAGRPAKLYARAEREIAVSVPPRDYLLAARLRRRRRRHHRPHPPALSAAAERLGGELARGVPMA
jgi:hypothetical protein